MCSLHIHLHVLLPQLFPQQNACTVGPNCLATQNGGINIKMKFSMLSISNPGGYQQWFWGIFCCGSSKMIGS